MIGGIIVNDDDWSNTKSKVKPNATFMLMGSADSLPEAPKERTKFIEDMTDSEAAAAVSSGLNIVTVGKGLLCEALTAVRIELALESKELILIGITCQVVLKNIQFEYLITKICPLNSVVFLFSKKIIIKNKKTTELRGQIFVIKYPNCIFFNTTWQVIPININSLC